jgi:hypothetical protein
MSEPQQPFDAPTEREWQLQERARRAERAGAADDGGDARAAHYRLIARVLRAPPLSAVPADFARQAAAFAERSADAALERWLLRFGLAAAAAVIIAGIALVGPQWNAALAETFGDPAAVDALQWSLAILGCLGLSAVLDYLFRRKPRFAR